MGSQSVLYMGYCAAHAIVYVQLYFVSSAICLRIDSKEKLQRLVGIGVIFFRFST